MHNELLHTFGYARLYKSMGLVWATSGASIDLDGTWDCYSPEHGKGRDYLGNAGHPGNWWALVTDSGSASGNPLVQGPLDPKPGYFISTTALQDVAKHRADPTRYVDGDEVPFIVLPPRAAQAAFMRLGDVAAVFYRGRWLPVIYGDVGPRDHFGEISPVAAEFLGIPADRDGGVAHGVLTVLLPDYASHWPLESMDLADGGTPSLNWRERMELAVVHEFARLREFADGELILKTDVATAALAALA